MALDKKNFSGSFLAWKWTGAETLDFVHALNERCLQVLGHRVNTEGRALFQCEAFEIVRACQELWLQLDEAAVRRAAKSPVLLLDVRFDSLAWWRESHSEGTNGQKDVNPSGSFPADVARELTAETLTLAWHATRSDAHVASIALGLSPGIAGIIAGLTPREVQRIAVRQAHQLRPRWESNLEFWEQLLRTAIEGRLEYLSEFHLQSLELLGNDLLRAG
jgi:hypothetical protein